MRKVVGMAKNPAWGKLGPNREGPYRITFIVGIGATTWRTWMKM